VGLLCVTSRYGQRSAGPIAGLPLPAMIDARLPRDGQASPVGVRAPTVCVVGSPRGRAVFSAHGCLCQELNACNSDSCAAGQPVFAVKLSRMKRVDVLAGNVIVTVLPDAGLNV